MTKIYSPLLIQKDLEYWLRYWTEERPVWLYTYPGFEISMKEQNEQTLLNWQKSFKEVRIHPKQVKAFERLAETSDSFLNSGKGWTESLQQGISLPPDNIEIKLVYKFNEGHYTNSCSVCNKLFSFSDKLQPVCKECCEQPYAFLNNVEKEEKPEHIQTREETQNEIWTELYRLQQRYYFKPSEFEKQRNKLFTIIRK